MSGAPAARPDRTLVLSLIGLLTVSIILCGLSTVVTLQRMGKEILPSQRDEVKNIRLENGLLYIGDLTTDRYSQHLGPSIALLLENGVPLPYKNIEHSTIRKEGMGRFSFWHSQVYFSASDNSDPSKNGRVYTAVYPLTIPSLLAFGVYSLTCCVILIFLGTLIRFRARIWKLLGGGSNLSSNTQFAKSVPFSKSIMPLCLLAYRYKDILICLLIAALTLFIRWNTSLIIQTGGDATNYWAISAQLSSGEGISSWHHKSARFGILIPVTISQFLFGYDPIYYYITPLLFWVFLTVVTYLTGKRIANRAVGIATALSLLAFSQLDECASQILPSIFETVYLLLAFYLLTFIEKGRKGTFILLLAVVAFILGYGSKETNIFFLPGVCLFLWIRTGGLLRPIQFGSAMTLFICAETAFYYFYAGISGGRLGVMSRSHLEVMTNIEPNWYSLIIGRFLALPTDWLYLYAAFGIACLHIPFSKKSKEVGGMAIGVLSFVLLMLCAIKKVEPLTPAVRFLPRYLDVTAPLILLVIFNAAYDWMERILSPLAKVLAIPRSTVAQSVAVIVAGIMPVLAVDRFQPTPFKDVRRISDLIAKSLEEERPIVMLEEKTNRTLSRLLVGAYREKLAFTAVTVGSQQLHVAGKRKEMISEERVLQYLTNGENVTFLSREPLEVVLTPLNSIGTPKP